LARVEYAQLATIFVAKMAYIMMSSTASRQLWARVLLFVTPLLWAVNYVVARKAAGVVEPHALALGRWLIAALILLWLARAELLLRWRELSALPALDSNLKPPKPQPTPQPIPRSLTQQLWQHGWRYLVLGALGMWICGAWVYHGARSTSAMNIALIYSVSPVLIAVGAWYWLQERMRGLQVLGAALALAGVLHVVLKGQWTQLASVRWVAGDLWIVACAFSWAAYALLLRRWPSRLSPQARLAVTAAAGVLVLLPGALWELATSPLSPLTLSALQLMLAAAIFPGLGAYWAYAVMQRELGAARVGVALYLGPLYAAVLAWLLLGEVLNAYHYVGALLIIPGLALVLGRRT
jgi:drug/metabolite transporter (DMT)-like permease